MAAHVLGTADTLAGSLLGNETYEVPGLSRADTIPARRELVSAAIALRQRLRSRGLRSPADIVAQVAERTGIVVGAKREQKQHDYQEAILAVEQLPLGAHSTRLALNAGMRRLELSVPAQLRLWKWQARSSFSRIGEKSFPVLGGVRRSRRLARRLLPLLLVLGATAACGLVSQDGSSGLSIDPGAPSLSKPKAGAAARTPRAKRDAPWAYVLPLDHGVRADRSGQGHFRAPRFHGEHNGLDLLAPVGTPVFSPCDGQVMAGASQSFGRWLHVICPVPDAYMKAGGPRPWASFFYAHLDKTNFVPHKWLSVNREQTLGAVGKSGNASSASVKPHLHLEFIVQKNRRHAMDERHLGRDQSSVAAAEYFATKLASECMAPYGFRAKSKLLRRARRIDPFVALTCLSQQKPNYEKAPSPLASSSFAWSKFYSAKDFDVNLGVEDSLKLARTGFGTH